MVYFIGNHGYIKIGFSDNPIERINELADSVPFKLDIYAIVDGDEATEKYYQQLFEKYHVNREWFVYSDEIRKFIDELKLSESGKQKKRNKKFFGYLKLLRLKEGHTLYSLGRKMNVHPTWVDDIERGYENDALHLKRLKKYLDAIGYEIIIEKKERKGE